MVKLILSREKLHMDWLKKRKPLNDKIRWINKGEIAVPLQTHNIYEFKLINVTFPS